MIAFGPVPSRRLGQSLGINNIPPRNCSYACVYCQLGRTTRMQVERQPFYEPKEIWRAARDKVAQAREAGEAIDVLAFVPDGEPTLDIHLGREVQLLKRLELPIGVITNASLLWRQDVRDDLFGADWISLKVDAIEQDCWRLVNRPHGGLELASLLEGALEFASNYAGQLVTETMLVAGINDQEGSLGMVAKFLARLQPATAYLAIPTRPPAEDWVHAPDEAAFNRAFQILSDGVERVETLVGYEGEAFAFTGDVEQDLLSIAAVHPVREEAVDAFLTRAGAERVVIERLVKQGQLVEREYRGHKFFLRKLGRDSRGA